MLDSLVRVSRRAVRGTILTKALTRTTGSAFVNTTAQACSEPARTKAKAFNQQLLKILVPPTLPFQRFRGLFHSLSKVLFTFPSRYLFAIGLLSVFSLRRSLPPNSTCNPKHVYSLIATRTCGPQGTFTLSGLLFQRLLGCTGRAYKLQFTKVIYIWGY